MGEDFYIMGEKKMEKISIRVYSEADVEWVWDRSGRTMFKPQNDEFESYPCIVYPQLTNSWAQDPHLGKEYTYYSHMGRYTILDFRKDMDKICEFFEQKEEKPPFDKVGCMKLNWVKDGIEVDDHTVTNEQIAAAHYYQNCREVETKGVIKESCNDYFESIQYSLSGSGSGALHIKQGKDEPVVIGAAAFDHFAKLFTKSAYKAKQ